MTYDETLFERTFWGIALSQRLKHGWRKFKGTLSLAFRMLYTNFFLGLCARPAAFIILLFYLTLLSILTFLIVKKLADPRSTSNGIVDENMDDAIYYLLSNRKNRWYIIVFLILMWGFLLAVLMSPTKERYGTGV